MASHLDNLVLIVGSNPLPNFVVASVLKPQQVYLIHSEQTKDAAGRLKSCFDDKLAVQVADLEPYRIADAGSVSAIREVAKGLPLYCALNYTGGTKVMAAHLLEAWRSKGGADANASYLDDRSQRIRFDDGSAVDLPDIPHIDLKTLAELHGLTATARTPIDGGPTREDTEQLARKTADEPALATRLYESCHTELKPKPKLKSLSLLKQSPIALADFGLKLSQSVIPAETWTSGLAGVWMKFLRSDWQEDWVASLAREIVGGGGVVHCGVQVKGNGPRYELDVVVIRGFRLYAISCTTEHQDHHICKGKLFEVALRARQLGGDLARSAFVCLLDRDGQGNDWADVLQRQVNAAWDDDNRPQVFGRKHVSEWLGGQRQEPNVGALKAWLDS